MSTISSFFYLMISDIVSLQSHGTMEQDNIKHWPDSHFSKKVFLHSVVEADKREKEVTREKHFCEEKGILHSCHGEHRSEVRNIKHWGRVHNMFLYWMPAKQHKLFRGPSWRNYLKRSQRSKSKIQGEEPGGHSVQNTESKKLRGSKNNEFYSLSFIKC